jgi:hypothetical protein
MGGKVMRGAIASILAIALGVAINVPFARADGNTSPGNNAVFVSKSGIT